MKKLLFAIVLTCAGCANLTIRPVSDYNNGPYYCTETINKMIDRGWSGKSAIARTFLPVLLIDWPFDAVTDTLLWPYDAIAYHYRMKDCNKRSMSSGINLEVE